MISLLDALRSSGTHSYILYDFSFVPSRGLTRTGLVFVGRLHEEGLTVGVLLDKDLEVLVDDGDSKEDTGTGANGTHEVGNDSEGTDTHTTESGGDWDVTTEDLLHLGLTVAHEGHVLVAKLTVYILRGGARHINPSLGEEGTCHEHEREVHESVEWILDDLGKVGWRRHVVGEASDRDGLLQASPSTAHRPGAV